MPARWRYRAHQVLLWRNISTRYKWDNWFLWWVVVESWKALFRCEIYWHTFNAAIDMFFVSYLQFPVRSFLLQYIFLFIGFLKTNMEYFLCLRFQSNWRFYQKRGVKGGGEAEGKNKILQYRKGLLIVENITGWIKNYKIMDSIRWQEVIFS